MATTKKTTKKSSSLSVSKAESSKLVKQAQAEMKKHGFKTLKEYTDYIDKKRGY